MAKEINRKWAEIVARAWRDEKYKKRLLEHPQEVLEEEGIVFPQSLPIRIQEGKSFSLNITIPQKPPNASTLGESELKKLSAAGGCWPH